MNPWKKLKQAWAWYKDKSGNDPKVAEILEGKATVADNTTQETSRFVKKAIWIGAVVFIAWAALAPLSQGVPVHGYLKVDGNSKTIQHLKGGIIEEILVKEGDEVKPGQTLIRLNDVQLKAQLGIIEAQLISALAVEARLLSERDARPAVLFPEFLHKSTDPQSKEAMRLQSQLFKSRKDALEIERALSRETIAGLKEQLQGVQAQEKSRSEQLKIFQEEYNSIKPLYEQGFIARNRIFELERSIAMMTGQRSEDLANIGRIRSQIAENAQKLILTDQNYRKEVETALTDAQKQSGDLKERYVATQDDLSRVSIVSPVGGVVVGLTVFTTGGVIQGGAKIMDIVPKGLPLVVEVQVPTHLIDSVRAGLDADVHFTALERTQVPTIEGKLTYVSADRQSEANRPDISYFIGRISIEPAELRKIGRHEIQAGMPAEVVIKTGERTLLGYLSKPFVSRLMFAFKER